MTIHELILGICARPEMWFGRQGLELTFAFLEGFDYAEARNRPTGEPTDLTWFRWWLAERLYRSRGMPRNTGAYYYVKALYPDDEEAFAELPKLYEEFLEWDRTRYDWVVPQLATFRERADNANAE